MASRSTTEPFPGFGRIYALGEPGGSRAFRGEISLSVPDSLAVTRGELSPKGPVNVKWAMGMSSPSDVIRLTIVGPIVVHQRVIDELRQNRLTGWGLYDVGVSAKNGDELAGYYGLSISGRCGPVENSRSTQKPKNYPGGVFPVWVGLYFDPVSWDGSDVFMASDDTRWIFATEPVVRLFERMKAKNVKWTALDDVERAHL